ncbi:hypothetical protein [Bordetella petrii]|uniref:hypothetical protein n=1 Tax=Bordetella petrii TaxID=94624 RepID=UPI001E565078|nr:hypothetical protein [Bordetella petrii]MCD0505467.1 hypothetical protein [Bordetella petrii]
MSRYAIRSSLAALGFAVAAAGLSGTALAAPDANAEPPRMHGEHRGFKHGDHRGGKMMRDGFWVPGVGPLSPKQVESLKLDAKQKAAFDAAKQAQGDMHKAMREHGGKRHDLLASQLESGKLDPHALAARQDENHEQFRKQADQVRGKWLAAWDTLNDSQRQQVAGWAKERHAKMQERHAKKQERRAARQAGEPGQPAQAN